MSGLHWDMRNLRQLGQLCFHYSMSATAETTLGDPRNGENPLVSVMMLAFNSYLYLDDAITSVIQQTFKDWELIIVQDGNNGRISEAITPWLAKDSRIRYFHRPVPGNIGSALNFGMTHARGEYIAILDDDDAWVHDQKLRWQIDYLQKNPAVAAVGGGAIVVDEDGCEKMRYTKPADSAECEAVALFGSPIIHSTMMIRRSALSDAGAYDEGFPGYQDWDMILRVMRTSKLVNLREHLVAYRVWGGGASTRLMRRNAWTAVRIVARHSRFFPGAYIALPAAFGFYLFSLLPAAIRDRLYRSLTKIKKKMLAR